MNSKYLKEMFIDENIMLRVMEPKHGAELFNLINDNREYLKTWLHWVDSINDPGDTIASSENNIYGFYKNHGFKFGVFYTNKLIGIINYHYFNWEEKHTSLGYWISKDYEGRGIMTKAVHSLVKYAFNFFQLDEVFIEVKKNNVKSRAIPEKLGFRKYKITQQKIVYVKDSI